MTPVLVTPPALEPVTLAEAKAHLRLDTSVDDDLVGALIAAARIHLEATIRRVLIQQTWRVYLDDWPTGSIVELPVAPVSAVSAITVYGPTGAPLVMPASAYQVDVRSVPARVRLIDHASLIPRLAMNGIEIDLVAGYGPSGVSVPQPLREAIMVLVTRWYENRDGLGAALAGPVPDHFDRLVAPYRLLRVA
jgi:uncharacterized phiE125 gp8 family phage protein